MLAMRETYSRFFMAILTQTLIVAVKDENKNQDFYQATVLGILSLEALIRKHYQQYIINNFSTKKRMILMNFIFDRILELKAYEIKELNVSKIMNLVSGDINTIEFQLNFVYALAIIPGSIILWIRFDEPIGLIAILICIAIYPLQVLIQKIAQKVLHKTKQHQDNRISFQNQMIEGIRLIKMYVWEKAFKDKIYVIRRQELILFKTHFLNLIDRQIIQLQCSYLGIIFIFTYHLFQ